MTPNILRVKRVSYGRSDTPIDRREYKSEFSGAVGTRKDWEDFAIRNGYDEVEYIEREIHGKV